jgi:DNA-binding transcriptional MerR regulator
MNAGSAHEWTLTEAARLLREPQHRLIYLCEKGVVVPDFQDAEGRGSSRRFSARNLLEFGIALRLRGLGIPAAVSGAVVYVLRGFEKAIAKTMPGFSLPGSLIAASAPELSVIIGDDERLYFSLGSAKSGTATYGGVPLKGLLGPAAGGSHGQTFPRNLAKEAKDDALRARVELSVTGIAQDLGLNG